MSRRSWPMARQLRMRDSRMPTRLPRYLAHGRTTGAGTRCNAVYPSGIGGQSRVEGEFPAGAPAFVAEVAVSSRSRDFGAKKRLYERAGVLEYLIAVPVWQEISWFERTVSGFQPIEHDADGILRSRCFPGLWLHVPSLWDFDLAGMNEVLRQGLATQEHAAFAARLAGRLPPAAPQ